MRMFFIAAILAMATLPAFAEEETASAFMMRLFTKVCIENSASPDKVRAYASGLKLGEITDPKVLEVFVGKGDKGAAWAIPAQAGKFILSIRGTTQACAIYAEKADPKELEGYFRKIIEGARRPGLTVSIHEDKKYPTPLYGDIENLMYKVSPDARPNIGFMYTMQAVEKPGSIYQATLQESLYKEP